MATRRGSRTGEDPWVAERSGPMTARRVSSLLGRIRAHQEGGAPASVTQLAAREDPFAVLVATLVSLRTKDEVTGPAARRLLEAAPDPAGLAALAEARIAELIYPAGFYRTKARTLRRLGETLAEAHGGRVPDTLPGLLALDGVGRKTANLVLTLGFGKPGVCVDIHVHRIMNRLGFVRTRQPDDTERVLRARLPRRWWIPVNDLLVTFGQQVCTPTSPWCSRCPVADGCLRVDVPRSR